MPRKAPKQLVIKGLQYIFNNALFAKVTLVGDIFLIELSMRKVKKSVYSMEWVTVYIAGKPGFKEEVLRNLGSSRFPFMPGTAENESLCLFWMDERSSIRDFKKAIGSKTVFKYRLQFYSSLEKYNEANESKKETTFSPQEKALIYKMSSWEATNRIYRHSA